MNKRIRTITAMLFLTVYFLTIFYLEKELSVVQAQEKTVDIYHVHSGNTSTNGGCFGTAVLCNGSMESITETLRCGRTGSVISQTEWRCGAGHIDTNSVGNGWYDYTHGQYCSEVIGTKTYYKCRSCGSCFDNNPGMCSRVVRYDKNCNYGDQEVLARLKVSTSTDEWTTEVVLHAEVIPVSARFDPSASIIVWNGVPLSRGDMVIKENSVARLEVQGNSNQTGASCDVEIKNIDSIAPVAERVDVLQSESSREQATIRITASDSGPSGLASEAYSFDGGTTWINTGEYTVTNNGTYSLRVRDKTGNQWEGSVSVTQIVVPKTVIAPSISPSASVKSVPGEKNEASKSTPLQPTEPTESGKLQERDYTKKPVTSEASTELESKKSKLDVSSDNKSDIIYEETGRTPDLSRIVMTRGTNAMKSVKEVHAENKEESQEPVQADQQVEDSEEAVTAVSAPILLGEKKGTVIQTMENKIGIDHFGIRDIIFSVLIITFGTAFLLVIILTGRHLFRKKLR